LYLALFYKESYEGFPLSEQETCEQSCGIFPKQQTSTPTHHSSISAEFAANVKSDKQDLSKQPFRWSEKSASLSASKVVITSYPGSHSSQGTRSKKSKKEELKRYYQELIESLKVDGDNGHSLTGPTEQDWVQYFEQEKNNKRKTSYSRKMIKPAKCDARAGVSNIKKKGGFQTIFADSSKGFKRESFETFRQLEH